MKISENPWKKAGLALRGRAGLALRGRAGPVSCKGQLFSGDITIATMIFMLALALAVFLYNGLVDDVESSQNLADMQNRASSALEQLIRTPGVPSDWNPYTVSVIGLAAEDRILNLTKTFEFIRLINLTNYDTYKYFLGVGPYDFYLNATDLDSDIMTVEGLEFEGGIYPAGNTRALYTFRNAVLNDTIIRVNFIIWQ